MGVSASPIDVVTRRTARLERVALGFRVAVGLPPVPGWTMGGGIGRDTKAELDAGGFPDAPAVLRELEIDGRVAERLARAGRSRCRDWLWPYGLVVLAIDFVLLFAGVFDVEYTVDQQEERLVAFLATGLVVLLFERHRAKGIGARIDVGRQAADRLGTPRPTEDQVEVTSRFARWSLVAVLLVVGGFAGLMASAGDALSEALLGTEPDVALRLAFVSEALTVILLLLQFRHFNLRALRRADAARVHRSA